MTDDEINTQIIDVVLQFEGGFVNNAADRGGPTNFGITAGTLGGARKLGRNATVDEVRTLARADAASIYLKNYVQVPGFDKVKDGGTRLVLVDTGVLHGPGRSIAFLRQCVNLPGLSGAPTALDRQTLDALSNFADPRRLAGHLLSLRLQSYAAIVRRDKTQLVFLAGWVNRVASLLEHV